MDFISASFVLDLKLVWVWSSFNSLTGCILPPMFSQLMLTSCFLVAPSLDYSSIYPVLFFYRSNYESKFPFKSGIELVIWLLIVLKFHPPYIIVDVSDFSASGDYIPGSFVLIYGFFLQTFWFGVVVTPSTWCKASVISACFFWIPVMPWYAERFFIMVCFFAGLDRTLGEFFLFEKRSGEPAPPILPIQPRSFAPHYSSILIKLRTLAWA